MENQDVPEHLSPTSSQYTYNIQNIWYRTLHNTFATTSRRYQFQLSTAPTPICDLCNSSIDTTDHFIIGCPYKYEIWQLVWGRIRYADPASPAILALLRNLTIDNTDFSTNLLY
ncbi:hypothetical protein INT45_001799 [Circinella minor]|uniref:Reverse transcriptase zinc-binding domain-containing protein n=1 Tax=Circinella minor TaxID=1195481 RepID=A0A8H7RWH0_9FUNG|nr:hypothetical protein INT45_001799 [Circinella minor]